MSVKVSVLMLAYNQQRTIVQAVESALRQVTDFPVEIVVGEDCSTDRTRDLLREIAGREPQRIRLLFRESNLGIGENLRQTLAACQGEFVAVLEGDDYWSDPHKLQRQADALDAHPGWAICFHRVQVVHDDGSPPAFEPAEEGFPTETGLVDLLRRNYIGTASVMFRNRLFSEFPGEFHELRQQDFCLHVLNAQHGAIGYLPDVMAVYRKHDGSAWSSQTASQRWEWIFQVYEAVEQYLGAPYRKLIHEIRMDLVRQLCAERDRVLESRDYRLGHVLLRPVRALTGWLAGRKG